MDDCEFLCWDEFCFYCSFDGSCSNTDCVLNDPYFEDFEDGFFDILDQSEF